jgi:ABC-2 type transport system ATP-binding protein
MIEIRNLQKVDGQNTLLELPDFNVRRGEVVALVGPVGSGKETLLDIFIGKTRPTMGMVKVANIDPTTDGTAFSLNTGVLFAEDGLYQHRSPRANLTFFCSIQGFPKRRADEVLTQVGLIDQANARLKDLTSGLLRRLAFGRAILHEPKVLILVEPFARCDGASINILSNLIRQMAVESVAVLIMTDDSANLGDLCDTIHTLDQGRIVDTYHPQEEERSVMPFKIPVRLEGRVALVNPADILFADAQEGRAFLQTYEGRLPTQFTLTELEERLGRSGFFRTHRAYLVNLQHVKEVIPYTRNSFSLRLDDEDGTKIPLSKAAAAELRELLGY